MAGTGRRFRAERARTGPKLGLKFSTALGATMVVMSAGGLASQAAASSCQASGYVLVHRGGVVVWTAHRPDRNGNGNGNGNEGSVFACASPSGQTVLLQKSSTFTTSMVSNARVTQLRFAGNFVGFFLRTNVEVYSKFLVVLDRLHGRLELKDLAECDYNDECTGPNMTGYRLARSGWVAEVWPQVVPDVTGLLATNGKAHYQLDLTRISRLKLSHGRLHWSSPFGASSVRLGAGVITPPSPRALTACQLLTAAEVTSVFGPSSSSSASGDSCTYTSSTHSGRALTLKLTTGMTHAQMKAREHTISNTPYYCSAGQWWPPDDNFYFVEEARGDMCGYPGTDVRFVIFGNGAEVSLDLTAPPAGAATPVAHLSNAALDRLFGVPIKRP